MIVSLIDHRPFLLLNGSHTCHMLSWIETDTDCDCDASKACCDPESRSKCMYLTTQIMDGQSDDQAGRLRSAQILCLICVHKQRDLMAVRFITDTDAVPCYHQVRCTAPHKQSCQPRFTKSLSPAEKASLLHKQLQTDAMAQLTLLMIASQERTGIGA